MRKGCVRIRAIAVTRFISEHPSGDQNERQHGKRGESQAPIHVKQDDDKKHQQECVVDHRHDSGRKQIIQRIDVGGDGRG